MNYFNQIVKKQLLLGWICLFFFNSCFNIDSQLYNPAEIEAYLLEDYQEEVTFRLGSEFDIADSLISVFTLPSQGQDEESATEIYAIYVGDPLKIASDTVILYLHGNYGHMDHYWERIKLLANMGHKNRYGIMAIDYRGYGLSEGKPTEEGMYNDTEAAIRWLSNHGMTEERLAIYGFSLGCAPATQLTGTPRSLKPAWLIHEAPFASTAVMLHDAGGLVIPNSYITNLKVENAEEIKKVNQPYLWMHGVKDDFISIKTHGEVVFKNYSGERGVALRVPEAGHSTIPNTMGFPEYLGEVHRFILNQ